MEWIIFALLAAVFAALLRVMIKVSRNSDNETILFSKYFYALIPVTIVLIIIGWQTVPSKFYLWISLVAVLDVLAIGSMTLSVKHGPFSRSLPMLSFTPIFAIITGLIFLGEKPGWLGIVGIFVVFMGAYWLSYGDHKGILGPFKALYKEKGPKFMLITALLFSFVGVFWKKALLSGGINMTIILGTALSTLIMLGFFAFRGEIKEVLPNKKDWWKLIGVGLLAFGTIYFVLLGFQSGFVSYVSSIKKFSILLGVIIGAVFFKEKKPFRHIIGSLIMVGGAVLISLS